MEADADAPAGTRIAKVLARAGLCSRREAERWIAAGRVSVDGAPVETPALRVREASRIAVDGRALDAIEATRLWRYHKTAGLITSHRDPQGRPTVFENLPEGLPRVVSVGRLDLGSEGLLLLTNDGALARTLESPVRGWVRRYRARVFGAVDENALAALKDGVVVNGVAYGPIRCSLERRTGRNAWLVASLAEGRNREVRNVLAHLGLAVNRLIRIAYGPFQLGRLSRGTVAEVAPRTLREQLGKDHPR
jgi:23S rRNA pseudouridine2605 synthase